MARKDWGLEADTVISGLPGSTSTPLPSSRNGNAQPCLRHRSLPHLTQLLPRLRLLPLRQSQLRRRLLQPKPRPTPTRECQISGL